MNKGFQPYIAEGLATFAMVFIGAGSVLSNGISGGGLGITGIALAHGLALMCMTYAVWHISGAHINPVITLSLWVTEKIPTYRAIAYIISQLAGAALAGFLLKILFMNASPGLYLGSPMLGSGITFLGGMLVEALLSFFLVFVYFMILDNEHSYDMYGAAIGLVLTFDIITGYSLTGSAVNPALAFGPSLASGFWHNHLVYWIGPIIGGIIAAIVCNGFLGDNIKRK